MKCPVLGNQMGNLFNPDSVHGLLGNSAINLLASYPFYCLKQFN